MSILDDAIREHLELKRAHGADDSELKRLEDEAFGPPARPDEFDPFAEAPTEFLATAGDEPLPDEESGAGRVVNVADLQEAPLAPEPAAEEPGDGDGPGAGEGLGVGGEPGDAEGGPDTEEEAGAAEDSPASAGEEDHERDGAAVAERGRSTEEREAIAEQPTELFDVEEQFEDTGEPDAAAEAPSEEQLLDAELSEPRLGEADPTAGIDADQPRDDTELADEDDDFFNEQRLSDELSKALEMPLPGEPQLSDPSLPGPPSEEYPPPDDQPSEERTAIFDHERDEASEPGAETPRQPDPEHEDLLEDTPDFLEDAPEDDELWFEQKPPKDFDLGD